MQLVNDIVEVFEELLDEKGNEIPCADETEQRDRYTDDNTARLYGMEYWSLVEKIEGLLIGYPCVLRTSMGRASGKLSVGDEGNIYVASEQLDNYLEKYSME